ncbi:MAG: hypothetical protein A2091_11860 [Desulfuromonadales bacterium GWD2_61_12]|nr:MAG: hypothetical protein A2091_11860 [Desulfuromonadales bacterium GWD2_61_12]
MYRYLAALVFFLCTGVFLPSSGFAVPSQFGDTGLFSQPTAETLNAGNICIGLWTNCSSSAAGEATITPVTITLGLGSFLEAYGSYPSLLFNGDELQSGRGYANIGFKLRAIGVRSSAFKVAVDGQMRRSLSDDAALDGLTDKVGRLIFSYKPGRFGAHLTGGFSSNESPAGQAYDDQTLFGGGIEFYPTQRLRLIAEFETASAKVKDADNPTEATTGFQYFLSPHLTLNIGLGVGFSDASPDWRTLIGFSSCQGIGTFQTPIVRDVPAPIETLVAEPEAVKVIKVRTLSSLAPKVVSAKAEPVSKFEVPVTPNTEEVVVNPGERLAMPAGGGVSALPVAAIGSAGYESMQGAGVAMAAVAVAAPSLAIGAATTSSPIAAADSALARPSKLGRTYALNESITTDNGKIVGKKVVDDSRYKANFTKIVEHEAYFYVEFFHSYVETLPVWVEGDVKYDLSLPAARPFEDVSLKIYKVNGKTPFFKLHLGEKSEVFSFYPMGVAQELESKPAEIPTTGVEAGELTGSQAKAMPAAVELNSSPGAMAPDTIGAASAAFAGEGSAAIAAANVAPSIIQSVGLPGNAIVMPGAPAAAGAVPVVTPGAAPAGAVAVATPNATAAPSTAPTSAARISSPQGASTVAPAPAATGSVTSPAGVTEVNIAPAASQEGVNPSEAYLTSTPVVAGTVPVSGPTNFPVATSAPASAAAVSTPLAVATATAAPTAVAHVSTPQGGGGVSQAPTAATGNIVEPTSVLTPAAPAAAQKVAVPASKISFEKPVNAMVYRKFRLPEFTFGFDEWSLSEEGKHALAEVAESLRKEERWFFVRIDGYTDNIGSDEYNMNLGLRRAISAATYLVVNNGFDPNLMFIKGVGESSPVATNDSEEGRSLNRRIELLILIPKDGQ